MDPDHLNKFSIPLQQKVPHKVGFSEEKSFQGVDVQQTEDGQQGITIAFASGELKKGFI